MPLQRPTTVMSNSQVSDSQQQIVEFLNPSIDYNRKEAIAKCRKSGRGKCLVQVDSRTWLEVPKKCNKAKRIQQWRELYGKSL